MWKKREAIPLAVTDFLVGQRITPLVSPWSTTTRSESKPAEKGRSVIRLQEICWKGQEVRDLIGDKGGTVGCVLALFCWQVAQPSMYIAVDEGGKARPPEFSGDQLAGFKETGVAGGLMIMASLENGTVEGVIGGNIDTVLVGEDTGFNLPVSKAGTEG